MRAYFDVCHVGGDAAFDVASKTAGSMVGVVEATISTQLTHADILLLYGLCLHSDYLTAPI